MNRVRDLFEKINIEGIIRFQEPMSRHTTFQVGGPADVFVCPNSIQAIQDILTLVKEQEIPFFVLGGGANILVADRGISGVVMDMSCLNTISQNDTKLTVEAGLPVSQASAWAANQGLSGLDFIYAMPGSVGGAIWMNARCYGSEIADVLTQVTYIDEAGDLQQMVPQRADFQYKNTPFMHSEFIILSGVLTLKPEPKEDIWARMNHYEADRRAKGHFDAPCAGSIFKNNREFGAPSGKIIDSLGLRGLTCGDAQVSPGHANIIINRGKAKASDIRRLIENIQNQVENKLGHLLEPEVLFVGDW